MTRGVKKSLFNSVTEIPAGATFDFVISGTNYKIPIESMLTAFGAVGTLEQKGEITGVPVLSTVALVNYIRNIVAGSGILASLSPEGGVQLDHNLTADATGVPVLINTADASPTVSSLVAGTGVSVAATEGAIQIALSATPVSNKTVIVNEMADFPTAVSGVRTLEDETLYFITNDLTTSDRFVLGSDTVVSGSDGTLISLTYTGSGVMFTSANNSNKLKEIALVASSGTLIDISGTGTELFQMVSCRATCGTIGDIENMFVSNFTTILWTVSTDGVTFAGDNSIITFSSNVGSIAAGTFVELGVSTTDGFSFTDSLGVLPAGTTFISGAADSANINTGGLATVINTRAQGTGTALSGVSQSDALWEFYANNGIANSITSMLAHHGSATLTIAATSTPVIIGATWDISHESRFEGTAGGRFTYTGKGAHVNIAATITADIVSGTKIACEFYIYKNGVIETNSGVQRDFTSGNAGNFGMIWQLDLETGDYFEIFAENQDSTANITILNAIVDVS